MSTPARGAVYAPLTPGNTSGGGTIRVYVGRFNVSGPDVGWFHSSDNFANISIVTTNPSPPEYFYKFNTLGEQGNVAVTVDNKMYYAGNITTPGTDVLTIRVWDGILDREFARIPKNVSISATAEPYTIYTLLAVGATIYFSVLNNSLTGNDASSTIYSLDTKTGVITKVGGDISTAATDAQVISLGWSLGRLWAGTSELDPKVYYIRPSVDTAWTLDETFTAADVDQVKFLIDYRGTLFAGTRSNGGAETATIQARAPLDGAWTSSVSAPLGIANFTNATIFKGNLYVALHHQTGDDLYVKKYDGTTWSDAYTALNATTGAEQPFVFSTAERVYFFRGVDNNDVVVSSDGTTWGSPIVLTGGNTQSWAVAAILV